MILTKDEEINKILDRAEKYREQYNEKLTNKKNVKFEIDNDIGDIFKKFFGTSEKHNFNDKNNVFIKCKLNPNELKNGCTKNIKYKFRDKNNRNIIKRIEVKIPKNIQEGQKIIIYGCGNYIKERNQYSNLVINIVMKGFKRK